MTLEKPTRESVVVDKASIRIPERDVLDKLGEEKPELEVDYSCIVVITGLPITKNPKKAKSVMKLIYLEIIKKMDAKLPTKDSINIPVDEEGVSLGMCLIEFKTAAEAKTCIYNFDGNIEIFGPSYPLHIVPYSSIDKLLKLPETPEIPKTAQFVPFERKWMEWYEDVKRGPQLMVRSSKQGVSFHDVGPICGIKKLEGDNAENKREHGWSKTGLYVYSLTDSSVDIYFTTPNSGILNLMTSIPVRHALDVEFSQDDRFILCKTAESDHLWALNPTQPIKEFGNKLIKYNSSGNVNEEKSVVLEHLTFSANGRQLMRLVPEKGVQFYSIQMARNGKDKAGETKHVPFYKISPPIFITIPDAVKIAVLPSEETFYHVDELRKDKYITSDKPTDEAIISVTSVVGPSLLTVFQRSPMVDSNRPSKISVFVTAYCTVTTMLLDKVTGTPALVGGVNPYTYEKQILDFNQSSTLVSGKKSVTFNTSSLDALSNGLVVPAGNLQLIATHNIFNVKFDSLINTYQGSQAAEKIGYESTFSTTPIITTNQAQTNTNKNYDTIGLTYGIDWSSSDKNACNDTILLCVSCKVVSSSFSVGDRGRRNNRNLKNRGELTTEELAALTGAPIPSTTYEILSLCQRIPSTAVERARAVAETHAKSIFSGNGAGMWFTSTQVPPPAGNGAVVSLQQTFFDGTPAFFQTPRLLKDKDETGNETRRHGDNNKEGEKEREGQMTSIMRTSSKGLVTLLCVGYILTQDRKPKRLVIRKLTAAVTSSSMNLIKEGNAKASQIGAFADVAHDGILLQPGLKLPNVNISWDKYGGHFATVAMSFNDREDKTTVYYVDVSRCEIVKSHTAVGTCGNCLTVSPDGGFVSYASDSQGGGARVAHVRKEWGDEFSFCPGELAVRAAFRPYPAERTSAGLFSTSMTHEFLVECQREARAEKQAEELKKLSYSAEAINSWNEWRERTAAIREKSSSYTPRMVEVVIGAGTVLESSKRKMTAAEITNFM